MSLEHAIPVFGTADQLRTLQQVTGAGTTQVEVVTDSELTVTSPDAVTVTGSSTALLAATTGIRYALLSVPMSADTGVHVAVGTAATTSKFLMEPGSSKLYNTPQAINAIRAGSTNVTVYIEYGAPP